MGYLKLEKALMTNLDESLRREVLRTNRSGAYACSTVVDCHTRKYHGLLVVPVPAIDDENHVLLSSLDATVVQHGTEFNLAVHNYQGNSFYPNGHKYIREFDCQQVPTTIYRVGGVVLKKEMVFQHYENRILIRYTLLEAHSMTLLRFRPFLAFRSVRQFTHENASASREYSEIENGIKTRMYEGYPDLYMQFSKKNDFIFTPDWYRGLEYMKEKERGYASNEDLYVPGYFEIPIKKGESIVFAAGVKNIKTSTLKKLFDNEVGERTLRDDFYHCLVNAAHQFHSRVSDEERYLLAGYPWFKCRARDTFIALPGLTLAIGEISYFEYVMDTAIKGIREFMAGEQLTVKIYEMEQPDVMLWAIWAIQQYSREVGADKQIQRFGDIVNEMINFIIEGKHPNLRVDPNGLVYSNGREKPCTWMNSTNQWGQPIVPRSGYIVEFNSLWYNALKFAEKMAEMVNNAELSAMLAGRAELCKISFLDVFMNEHGYLYDYVDGKDASWEVRPNQIFAVSLGYSPLDLSQQKSVLDICTRELLTPKGLRSLSPKSGAYNPIYEGPQIQRDYAYHQGTVWPWLGGFYMEACLKIYKRTRLSFIQRQLVGYEEELFFHTIGTIPELFDGNPPFTGRGALSFAMNVAEILRTIRLMEKITFYNK